MPQLVSGDILLYVIRYSQQSQRFMNTLALEYFDVDGVTDDYATFCNALLARYNGGGHIITGLTDMLSSTISIDEHSLQKIHSTRLAPIRESFTGNVGAIGTGPAPLNSAVTLTKRTINATRWGIGSWHQPGLNVADMNNSGNWKDATTDALADILNVEFLGAVTPAGMVGNVQPVLFNPAVPTRKTPIISFFPNTTIRTMHRRTVRVGE